LRKLNFAITTQKHEQRVREIFTAFFGGFNAMLAGREISEARAACESFSPLLRPFAHEGAAMGYPFKAVFSPKYRMQDFSDVMRSLSPDYFLMHYIGLGFWCGMVYRLWPSRVRRVADGLSPFYKYLCYDGFGFKLGLFHYLKNPGVVETFLHFNDYARQACFQGFGRSLWFLFMDAPDLIKQHIASLDRQYAGDCYSGLGLAVAFTQIDDLSSAFKLSDSVEPQYRADYFLGMMLALYTRRMTGSDYLTQCLDKLEPWQKTIALSGLQSCDERFQDVAARFSDRYYEEWRRSVTEDLRVILSSDEAETVRRM
jgi:hypothetical protein